MWNDTVGGSLPSYLYTPARYFTNLIQSLIAGCGYEVPVKNSSNSCYWDVTFQKGRILVLRSTDHSLQILIGQMGHSHDNDSKSPGEKMSAAGLLRH